MDNIILEFDIIYKNILDIYNSNNDKKWDNISLEMNKHSYFFPKLFNFISSNSLRNEISLDYTLSLSQLNNSISKESDPIVKSSYIILAIHYIIYDLISKNGNYYFDLIGKSEMQILKKNIIYYINLDSHIEQNINFHAFFLIYALESLFNKHFYIGIDFEYTFRQIKLAQLNFEHNVSLKSIIYMVDPTELDPIMLSNFINLIICNKYIKKILHGSDSLDIPYMYNQLLDKDPEKIISFTKTMIDTRFLCEYYKLTKSDPSNNKCSIYDEESDRSAIYYFNVISEKQQEKLSDVLKSMPPPHDIVWNIHKMPKSQVLYAQYDVIFLKYFYYRIIYMATLENSTDLGKRNTIELYRYVLFELTQFIYLEQNQITFLIAKCKEEVDTLNNYFIKKSNLKMIDIFNKISINLITYSPNVNIDNILKINHFKKYMIIIIKRITYGFISQICKVYKDKNNFWSQKLNNQFIFDFFVKLDFNYLHKLFLDLQLIIQSRIKDICL